MKQDEIKEKKTAQGISNPVRPRLMPLKAAAAHIGIGVWPLRDAIWKGLIPVFRFPGGRKMFIDSRDIDKFIERNKTTF